MRLAIAVLAASLLFTTIAKSDMAMGKAAAQYPHQITDIIKRLTMIKETRPLVPEESQQLEAAQLAQEVFDTKTVYSSSRENFPLSSVSLMSQIRTELRAPEKWNMKLSPEVVKKLEAKKDFLRKEFGENTYEWAWVLNQTKQIPEAKKILATLFNQQHQQVMKETQAVFGFGTGPLSDLEPTYQALDSLSDQKEKAELQRKMQQAKKHISALPESHIMT